MATANDDESGTPASEQQLDHEPDRLAQPVDAEEPPRLPFPVVGVGASAGGLEAYSELFKSMRSDSGMAFVLIQHLPPERESMIADILSKRTSIPVTQVEDGMKVEQDNIYVIRPGYTLTIHDGKLHLGERLDKPGHSRPVDDFFKSLAEEQRERAIAVIMSGMGSNGTAGAQAVKAVGGVCIAQDPDSAQFPSMPRHLIDAGYADYILRPEDIPEVLMSYAGHPYARGGREHAQQMLSRDQSHLREILTVLRTRTRQDFGGYKKQTVLRRVQRRMGLNRITQLGDYGKLLRQNPSEVSALSDDLLIHVTGFFRDPEVWESLRQNVVVPLVAARDSDAAVRCWVTACSSGEEAYTLAILLVEECERVGKPLDIKVFATDMAERTLQNARHGVFVGGIEAEITPERLERFFRREDAVYRVRQELRELVVFAPQNVLQDPPFSRLDIVTCRNLLIYLEPDVQRRVLSLLHFGIREGGALVLGTSETVAGAEDMFDAIDKKARIFRRIGPTRHGTMDFPLPRNHSIADPRLDVRSTARPSLTAMTTRALLEHHLPAAVTVDRDFRIVYFHGNTDPFLSQPRGEATRDLFAMLRESVRGTVRTALHRAAAQNSSVTMLDGWLEVEGMPRQRIAVTVSPLESGTGSDHFVVSFQERGEYVAPVGVTAHEPEARDASAQELLRVRDELQTTVEELQTSNEELKAAHEELVSINEELQSTNEELETSREEMQSLNEELTTVNAQLQAKIEEHQAARDDLASVFTSTDIAVLFLDSKFRIRRFTPAIKPLLEMIQSDVGRPLSDLARKFKDPELVQDSETVLERLIPVDREISANNERWFHRRVLPYRTADNRIDGVIITFQDVTDRKRAEAERQALLERERAARADAEAANRVKDEFLAVVSHELRTPLSAILLWAKMLGDGNVDPKQLKEGLAAISHSADAQRDLIEDLLDTSRIIAGKLRLVVRDLNLFQIVQNAVEAILPVAKARGVAITSNLQDIGIVSADGARLHQVVLNILTNAVKFTPAGGHVDVSLLRLQDEIEIKVTDTGHGIAPESLARVFDRFHQADSSTTRNQGGLGLGLAITKQLVELHGGTVKAESAGRGRGATFIVRLPLPEVRNAEHIFNDVPRSTVQDFSLKNVRILVVEDDSATRNALSTLLQNAGAKVETTDSAAGALDQLRRLPPDVLVSDIGLPTEDGYYLIRRLREREASDGHPQMPAIALTAFARESDRARALSAGFQQHVVKPVDPAQLLTAIQNALNK